MAELEVLSGADLPAFLSSDVAVLVLSKSDCGACAAWAEELKAHLASLPADDQFSDVRYGKLVLDTRGLTDFKRANQEWLAKLDVLPFNVIYQRGERAKSWAGGGVERLTNRLSRLSDGS